MPNIPSTINSVAVDFAAGVDKSVKQIMIDGLKHCIKSDVAEGYSLERIYISSANDSHDMPSRHAQQKAVDISRINGTKIVIAYPEGGAVQAIVDAIQDAFEDFGQRRENFGPHLKKKSGNDYTVSGHADHIHLSVN